MSDTEADEIENTSSDNESFTESINQSPSNDSDVESEDVLDESEDEPDETGEPFTQETTQIKPQTVLPDSIISPEKSELIPPSDELSDDSDDELENLSKFDKEVKNQFLVNFHPESINHNYDEIYIMANVTRDKDNNIIDDLHKTIPILSKYEKTKVLGQRAKQINTGSKPFINVEDTIIDGLLIAQEELYQKKIPFIIRRPMPSGGSEYWHLADLEILD